LCGSALRGKGTELTDLTGTMALPPRPVARMRQAESVKRTVRSRFFQVIWAKTRCGVARAMIDEANARGTPIAAIFATKSIAQL
jgi:hypothetical protein